MDPPTLAKLTIEDLVRWRRIQARLAAIRIKPDGYSAAEIESTVTDEMQFWEDAIRVYDLEDTGQLTIAATTGRIYESTD